MKHRFQIKSKLWIECDDHVVLGGGKLRLLRAIAETRSLAKAARREKISYRKAWLMLHAINDATGQPVVITRKGGKSGGGTQLTAYGMALLETFEEIRSAQDAFLRRQSRRLEKLDAYV